MKTEMFLALVLFTIYQGSSQPAGSRIGFANPRIPDQLNDLSAYPKKLTSGQNPFNLNLWQAPGHYVYLEGDQVQQALADMFSDVPFDEFLSRYDCKRMEKQVQVTRFKFKDREQREVTEYASLGISEASAHQMSFADDTLMSADGPKGHWIVDHHPKGAFTKEFVQAFYLNSDFVPFSLPPQYTSMLQEAQSVVDTTTQYIQGQLAALNYQIAEAKQMQASWFLLSQKLADKEARKKRRREVVGELLGWLPLLLLLK